MHKNKYKRNDKDTISLLVKNIAVIITGENHQRMLKLIGELQLKKIGHLYILKVSPYVRVITEEKNPYFWGGGNHYLHSGKTW